MKKALSLLLILVVLAAGGFAQKKEVDVQSELRSLVETERAFARTATTRGIRDSFLAYLADDGILFRPKPVNGKQWMRARPARPGLLTWQPIYADVASAGDLGYTTGPWEFREKGPEDKPVAFGNFVTLWKKQMDGTWKFVVDLGISNPQPAGASAPWQPPANNLKSKGKSAHKANVESERASLLSTDREFSKASVAQGMVNAFLSYMADDVRLYRNDSFPFVGKEAARAALAERQGVLNWEPTKAEVSQSGDLAYTYGTYDFKGSGSDDHAAENGNYLRIWKRQANGKWKVVLDLLDPIPPPKSS
jgi:ketosteroid isomerase-like protein